MSETAGEQASKAERAASVERQLGGDAPPTEPNPNPAGGSSPAPGSEDAGESVARRGEDIAADDGKEPGREDTGTEGGTQRPTGESSARDATGVDPQEPIEGGPASPGTHG